MSAHQIFRLRNPALLMALTAAFPVMAYAAGAANVDFATGGVTAVNSVGEQRPLTKGAEIGSGDTIRTGDGGRAQVRFSDGAMVSLQPQTEFRIDNYQYSGKSDGEEKGFFSLLKGGLRTITGLVGRAHRDNYKITTNVATIGIRGTEYSAVLDASGNELLVNTGEGLVEVCNEAGCILLASGESGIVSGARAPNRTDSRPLLPPTPLGNPDLPGYARAEDLRPDWRVLPASAPVVPVDAPVVPVVPGVPVVPLVSGDANYVAVSGMKGGSPHIGLTTSPSGAVIDSNSVLTSFVDGSNTFSATSINGGFSKDGVIGWGLWSSGTWSGGLPLDNFHYVVGTPTPAGELTALGGLTANYTLVGYTTPTTSMALTGGTPTATFSAVFSYVTTVALALSVPVAGTTYSDSLTGNIYPSGVANFSLNSASSSALGFFAGANASHAGVTYRMDSGNLAVGDIVGALVFKR